MANYRCVTAAFHAKQYGARRQGAASLSREAIAGRSPAPVAPTVQLSTPKSELNVGLRAASRNRRSLTARASPGFLITDGIDRFIGSELLATRCGRISWAVRVRSARSVGDNRRRVQARTSSPAAGTAPMQAPGARLEGDVESSLAVSDSKLPGDRWRLWRKRCLPSQARHVGPVRAGPDYSIGSARIIFEC